MKCDYTVGQQVVCVARGDWAATKDWYRQRNLPLRLPRKGDILTIREIYWDTCLSDELNPGLRFFEIRNDPIRLGDGTSAETGFWWKDFAPVRKTDISIFERMTKLFSDKERFKAPA